MHYIVYIFVNLIAHKVYNGKANICMGGLSVNTDRASILRPLYPYHYTSFVFAGVVYKPYTVIEKMYRPFSPNVWLAIGVLLTLASIIIAKLKLLHPKWRHFIEGSQNDMPFFNMLALFLGQGITRPAKRNFARYLLVVWTLAAIIIRNSYQGVQFNNLRSNGMRSPPTTIEQLLVEQYSMRIHPLSVHFLSGTRNINNL